MSQASLEENFSSRENTLLKNNGAFFDTLPNPTTDEEVIIRGYDRVDTSETPLALSSNPNFIGPHDATNEALRLHERQAQNLAQVAVMNIAAYGREYVKVSTAVKHSLSDGILHLNDNFPGVGLDQQVDAFISKNMMSEYKSHDEVVADLEAERTAQSLAPQQPEHELQAKVNELKEDARKRLYAFVKARALLVESGVSAELIEKFSYTAGLMRAPEVEAYEREAQLDSVQKTPSPVDTGEVRLLDLFKSVLSPSFGRRALRSIGVLSPKSGEIKVVEQHDSTSR